MAWPSCRETKTTSCPWEIRMLAKVWRSVRKVTPSRPARRQAGARPRLATLRSPRLEAKIGASSPGGTRCEAMAPELRPELWHQDHVASGCGPLEAAAVTASCHLEADIDHAACEVHVAPRVRQQFT